MAIPTFNVNDVRFTQWAADGTPLGDDFEVEGVSEGKRVGMWQLGVTTFTYTFQVDNIFHVLEGEIELEIEGLGKDTFGPGDVFYGPEGAWCRWTNKKPMRAFFVIVGDEAKLKKITAGDVPNVLTVEA
ncbi:cupin domain-containing protein [Nocardioides sp. GY 10127]|uniref:cupin domain-containing protein n=1 Tax=Nocardioides sp. GY 10127 TaxID=2569762 RepID=UPI0010A94BCB|nr:cupin domain-containing protein [Nocardioides sp. GY 10127]TIC81699.1 DUF861 domain-containing protein [Nocardioides sp. GY 10127]